MQISFMNRYLTFVCLNDLMLSEPCDPTCSRISQGRLVLDDKPDKGTNNTYMNKVSKELDVPHLDVGYQCPTLEPPLKEGLVGKHLVTWILPMGPSLG